jgi:3-oxoacyl-[acyl-carrier protein] reductase
MDLEISGRAAIVCASSRGLGLACATALAAEGVDVVLNARTAGPLEDAARALRETARGEVLTVAADINTAEGRARLLAACPAPDILVTNNAGPTPRHFSDIDHGAWIEALEANMIAPLLLIKAVIAPMKERRFGRIVNITSAMVTTPRPHMVISSGPRAGMTAVLKGLALELAQFNITINNLLPERFDTDRQIFMARATAKREGITFEEARARQIQVSPAKRLGEPREFGAMCAFLCSNLAGYMSGQNIHLDGAAYPALI